MTVSELQVHQTNETTLLAPPPGSWTKHDYLATAILLLIAFGESVESYLPGVINQVVSCELGVSHFQEGVLGVALHACYAFSILGTALLSGRFVQKYRVS